MVVLRLVGILVLVGLAGAVALYLLTQNRQYLTFARRVLQFGFVFIVVFLTLYVLERLVLAF